MPGTKVVVDGETIEVIERDRAAVITVCVVARDTDLSDIEVRLMAVDRHIVSIDEQIAALEATREEYVTARTSLQAIIDDVKSATVG